jgi:hypothetical protein
VATNSPPLLTSRASNLFVIKPHARASLGGDEQPPPLLTSRAPLQFCLPSIHDIVIILLGTNKNKS